MEPPASSGSEVPHKWYGLHKGHLQVSIRGRRQIFQVEQAGVIAALRVSEDLYETLLAFDSQNQPQVAAFRGGT